MEKGIVTDLDSGMEDIPADKCFIRFSIKADATKENASVHETFKEFCKAECDNNYTIGLRTLLVYYQTDAKYNALWEAFAELKERILDLESKGNKPIKKEESLFGAD